MLRLLRMVLGSGGKSEGSGCGRQSGQRYLWQERRAFTLIELLVVIAIIAMLAGILFPVFSRAREQARKGVCMSNLKQVGVSIMMYAQDHDETLPASDNGTAPTFLWTQRLSAYGSVYTNVKGTLYCPSADTPTGSLHWYPSYGTLYYGPLRWYNNAKIIHYGPWTGTNYPPAVLTDIQDPSRTLLLGEQAQKVAPRQGYFQIKNTATYNTCFPGRHGGVDNVLFVDGHVSTKNTAQLNRWLEDPLRGGKCPYVLDF